MAIKIVRATEPMPVANIVLTIYGPPGTGKTSLACTAANPLLLDADKGSYRAANRKDTVQIDRWEDVDGMTAEDLAPFSSVILDTGGRILDKLRVKLIAENPKNAGGFGGMSGMGWNNMFAGFSQIVNRVLAAKKDLIIVCHMDEKQEGEVTKERIDVSGQSKNEIYKLSDAMCRIQVGSRGERFLDFDPREGGFGKNPAQLPRFTFPVPDASSVFLADVIAQIKTRINKITEKQAEAVSESQQWEESVKEASSLQEINLLVSLAKERKMGNAQKTLLAEKAKALGLEFDKTAGAYTAKAA
jgi:RecA/RadA recombinase